MTKPDDSTLDPAELRAVEGQAYRLLDRADAWDRYPVPVDDILSAAKVSVAPTSAFDAATIISYLRGKGGKTGARIKSGDQQGLRAIRRGGCRHSYRQHGRQSQADLSQAPRDRAPRYPLAPKDLPVLPGLQEDAVSGGRGITSSARPTTLRASSCSRARPSASMPRTTRWR